MKHIILPTEVAGCPTSITACFPSRLVAELARKRPEFPAEELRLRRGAGSCLRGGSGVVLLEISLSQGEMDGILNALCGGSMYAHQETLRQGYVAVRGGIRVGVCGRMRMDGGRVLGIGEVSSLVFRFPRFVAVPTDAVCRLLRVVHPGRGVLIYSPPGVGKTTMLRALIRALSSPPQALRLSVIDTREELSACGTEIESGADFLTGYPRAAGIGIATRTLNPQLILCDEIGEVDEAEAICAACNAGVPLVATAHGADTVSLLRRRGLRMMHESGVFGSYVGLSRAPDGSLTQTVSLARDVCCSR